MNKKREKNRLHKTNMFQLEVSDVKSCGSKKEQVQNNNNKAIKQIFST